MNLECVIHATSVIVAHPLLSRQWNKYYTNQGLLPESYMSFSKAWCRRNLHTVSALELRLSECVDTQNWLNRSGLLFPSSSVGASFKLYEAWYFISAWSPVFEWNLKKLLNFLLSHSIDLILYPSRFYFTLTPKCFISFLTHQEKTHWRKGSQNHRSGETDTHVEGDCTSHLEISLFFSHFSTVGIILI